jgi:heme-degrading monooxygenase HmoA
LLHIYWEFHCKPGKQEEFEQCYSGSGSWAEFFQRDPSYRKTIFLRDQANHTRYLTIDIWETLAAYQAFKQKYSEEYSALDKQFEALTESETFLGYFDKME